MRKKKAWPLWLLVPMLCTGCQLMPEEEELKTVPVIRSYEAEEYTQTIVMRGNLILSKEVDCTYVAAKQEELGFELGGVYIDKIYVSEGQQVQAGELLAELEYDNLKEEISSKQHELNVLDVRKTHILENRELELEAADAIWSEADEQEQQKQRESIVRSYEAQLQEVEDSLYIEQLRLDEMQEELKKRQIYAGIDGTVIHVKAAEEGERSVGGECVITVADLDTNVFTVSGEDVQYFPVGTQVTVVCGDKEYEAAAVSAEELGIEAQQGEESAAYLRLYQVDPTLEDGKKGSIEIVLDQRSDVLYVDKDAVKTANGEQLEAYAPVIYLADDSRLFLSAEYIPEAELKSADRLFAQIMDKEYEISYVPYDESEYIAMVLYGEELDAQFSFDESDDQIRSGQFAAVVVVDSYRENVLTIPANALYRDGSERYVYKQEGDQRIRCDVTTGVITDTKAEIVEGLQEGDMVYVKN